jgi:Amt family ammonium transporter
LFVIFWSALVTYILMKLIGLILRGSRYKDEILEVGDMAIHDEEAFPEGVSPEEAQVMSDALVGAGLGEGMPPDPGLAPSTHPEPPHHAREP